jgi:pyrimidine-nucleoside phosphorylase
MTVFSFISIMTAPVVDILIYAGSAHYTMNSIEIIEKKRQGLIHTSAEIDELVSKVMHNQIPDYQLSAWLMAAVLNGLNLEETTALTHAFVQSGECLDWSDLEGISVDKHSTGGVGDKTTLALIPMLASVGLIVTKLSGRGLGFTGGTIDKLESIPGFKTELSVETFKAQIRQIGMAISSQTPSLAPADGKLYALRDVTATVDSIPLIAASVVSKKIAAGADVIVLDIKYGQGAFMKDLAMAKALAMMCREVGNRLGKNISTLISAMVEPLGYAVGHSLEVLEVVRLLQGTGPKDLETLCLKLGAVAMVSSGKWTVLEEAEILLKQQLHNGKALEKFRALIVAQGGCDAFVETPGLLPAAKQGLPVIAQHGGYVSAIDALRVARACKLLGAGRTTKEDEIDLSVGVVLQKKTGEAIAKGELLAMLHANTQYVDEAMAMVQEAFSISEKPVLPCPLVEEVVLSGKTLNSIAL